MKDFSLDRRCSKCGFFTSHDVEYSEYKEVLIRTCRRCGYKWYEKCVDVEERGEQ